jgi:tetratricopeptide (TPR) repeat protein
VSPRASPTASLVRVLRESPTTLPCLAALVLFVIWASDQAGYPATHWEPGALVVLALLVIALVSVPVRLGQLPAPLRLALACLAASTLLSFLSILWAGVRADAWEGADRSLLYLLVFALFALWPRRGSSGAVLLCAWVLAMIGLAAFVLLHLDTRSSLQGFFKGHRLAYPGGYENASAATWAMVMWPAWLLATEKRLPWALRGVLAAGTVLLGDLALLSQSRGSLFSTPVVLALVFAFYPARVRAFAVLVPVAAGLAATAPAVLHVGDRVKLGVGALGALHSCVGLAFAVAGAVGVVVAVGAAIESRGSFSNEAARDVRRGLVAAALVCLIAVPVAGLVALGDPVTRVRHAWDTFTSGKGYGANSSGNRLLSGLGSNRYDFYRVAFDEFLDHPVLGIGADNFQQQYLARGHSDETPRYPHSLELRALSQSGVVGTLAALAGLVAAVFAGTAAVRARARPGSDPLAVTVACAALAGFAYWFVHGSFDWFWEFAGLGAPAFALLGLACSLGPRQLSRPQPGAAARSRTSARLGMAAGALVAAVIAASLVAPWLSQLKIQEAARIWPAAPRDAYAALNDAADLNPLSDQPYVLAGSIALRLGDLARADREFSRALRRSSRDAYATLERGAIASARGERARALRLLEREQRLDPHDPLGRAALVLTRQGGRVDVAQLNSSILAAARPFR